MFKRDLLRPALVGFLGFFCTALSADEPPGAGYVGAGLGWSYSKALEDYDALAHVSLDDKMFGWKLYGGVQFHDYFAFELGYLGPTQGDFTALDAGVINNIPVAEGVTAEYSLWSVSASLIGSIPTGGPVTPFLRVGVHRWESEAEVYRPTGERVDRSRDGLDPLLGAGVEWALSPRWSLRGEWEYYLTDDDSYVEDPHLFTAGARFRF